jgi:hypothetical protein
MADYNVSLEEFSSATSPCMECGMESGVERRRDRTDIPAALQLLRLDWDLDVFI